MAALPLRFINTSTINSVVFGLQVSVVSLITRSGCLSLGPVSVAGLLRLDSGARLPEKSLHSKTRF